MHAVFLGSEAIAAGTLTPGELRYGYRRLYPNVYIARDAEASLADRTVGAWLWSQRRAVIAGRAAAALHGARWVDDHVPIELIYDCKRPPPGIISRHERVTTEEVVRLGGIPVSSLARTALDLGRHLPLARAVEHLDAIANATNVAPAQILALADVYPGARGVKKLRTAVGHMDGGAQSPKETWLRMLLVRRGFPRPATQIPLLNSRGKPFAFLDMGWEDANIAVEYDGDHHREDRNQYVWDEQRLRLIRAREWLHVKVISEDTEDDIVERVAAAWRIREGALTVAASAR
ncbi:MAG: hypothetical protein PGN37_01465 [Mycobacterium kyogaense]|uniref:hypothetical protein n=1 Tax=Mycobacterium kyogaense TaxID=2212479 RepID=UPI002FFC497E